MSEINHEEMARIGLQRTYPSWILAEVGAWLAMTGEEMIKGSGESDGKQKVEERQMRPDRTRNNRSSTWT
jgi:hypothetical protein